jgi:hypothetical protein
LGRQASSGTTTPSSSSSAAQGSASHLLPQQQQAGYEEQAWAAQLLGKAAGLLLEGAQGLTWQEALQEGPASGGWGGVACSRQPSLAICLLLSNMKAGDLR